MPHLLARHWWALALRGLFAVLFGLLAFFVPGITLISLVLLFGFWAIFTGVLEIVAGVRLRAVIANELLLILMGVFSILFGIFILIFPGAGALAIIFWIGAYAVLFGIMLIALAVRLRGLRQLEA